MCCGRHCLLGLPRRRAKRVCILDGVQAHERMGY